MTHHPGGIYRLAVFTAGLFLLWGCFSQLQDIVSTPEKQAKQELIPQVNVPDEQSAFTSKAEAETWVTNVQTCLHERKWKCVEKFGQNLMEMDDPVSRAFGSWALGIASMDKKEYGVAYRYFGLAVRDNSYRYNFQKWFAASAAVIGQQDIAKRHLQWLVSQPESRNDEEVKSLATFVAVVATPDAIQGQVSVLDRLRDPASTRENVLRAVWLRGMQDAVRGYCAQMKTPTGFCASSGTNP